jgi:hypothetical protein
LLILTPSLNELLRSECHLIHEGGLLLENVWGRNEIKELQGIWTLYGQIKIYCLARLMKARSSENEVSFQISSNSRKAFLAVD